MEVKRILVDISILCKIFPSSPRTDANAHKPLFVVFVLPSMSKKRKIFFCRSPVNFSRKVKANSNKDFFLLEIRQHHEVSHKKKPLLHRWVGKWEKCLLHNYNLFFCTTSTLFPLPLLFLWTPHTILVFWSVDTVKENTLYGLHIPFITRLCYSPDHFLRKYVYNTQGFSSSFPFSFLKASTCSINVHSCCFDTFSCEFMWACLFKWLEKKDSTFYSAPSNLAFSLSWDLEILSFCS